MLDNLTKGPVIIYCCYAPADKEYFVKLKNHLKFLQRDGRITVYSADNIQPGQERTDSISLLQSADIVLLLITPDFAASLKGNSSIYNEELNEELSYALKQYKTGATQVRAILVRPVDFSSSSIAEVPILPARGIAVTNSSFFPDPDSAWYQIAKEVRHLVEALLTSTPSEPLPLSPTRRFTHRSLRVTLLTSLVIFIGVGASILYVNIQLPLRRLSSTAIHATQTAYRNSLVATQAANLAATQTADIVTATNDYADFVAENGMMEGFDIAHTGFNPYERILNTSNVSLLALDWNYTAGDSFYAAPIVADGRVFAGSTDGSLYALDAISGDKLWSYGAPRYIQDSAAFADGRVYVSSAYDFLYSVDAVTPIYPRYFTANSDNYDAFSSPVVKDGIVYVGSWDHSLYALDTQAQSGASIGELWQYTTGTTIYKPPAVADNIVYLNSDKLYALDAHTGKALWIYSPEHDDNFSVPTTQNGTVYLGASNVAFALDAHTGKLRWQYIGNATEKFNSPSVANGILYISSNDATYAFNSATGKIVWKVSLSGGTALTIANDVIYFCDDNCYALDARSGALLWSYLAHSTFAPAVANGRLYVASKDNNVYAFSLGGE